MIHAVVTRLSFNGVYRVAALLLAVVFAPGAMASAQDGNAAKPLPGRIYLAVPRATDVQHGLLAVDPNDRTCVTLYEEADLTMRVAPGGRRVAFRRLDRPTRKNSVIVVDLERDEAPLQLLDKWGTPCWPGDGKQLLVCQADDEIDPAEPVAWRMNVDGSGRQALALARTEQVWDWSADGQWVVTSSARTADDMTAALPLFARPLYVMRIDGTEATQIVPAGKPEEKGSFASNLTAFFKPRFSPDGSRILFTRVERRGFRDDGQPEIDGKLWVVDRASQKRTLAFDGNDKRGYLQSAAWSPDGLALAAIVATPPRPNELRGLDHRLVVLNLEGKELRDIPLPHPTLVKVVDWR